MGQTLYLECNCGISGDMTVAALLDLGADPNVLQKALRSMPLQGFEIQISRVKKAGLDVCDFNVKLDQAHENHDHDMEYLHGHDQLHSHKHETAHGHTHSHEHAEFHGTEAIHKHIHSQEYAAALDHIHPHDPKAAPARTHSHEHRGLAQIQDIIHRTDMTTRAKATALCIFDILAQAEAKAHGMDISHVHFHEVGAIDSIVDIVAAAVCLDNLDITDVIIPYLCEGQGTIRCQHGILSIPVPAVSNIVQANELTLKLTDVWGELVTPTGAAIAAAVRTSGKLPEYFCIQKTGMGAGKRNYERPSILRAMLILPKTPDKADTIYKLETNIDDCTGELLGYVMEQLFAHGARDVFYTPIFMKKNRPAVLLSVICKEESIRQLETILFQETTTIGIRRVKMERSVLDRKTESAVLSIGEIQLKTCTLPNGEIRKYPEYEAAAELARTTGRPLLEILAIFQKELSKDTGHE